MGKAIADKKSLLKETESERRSSRFVGMKRPCYDISSSKKKKKKVPSDIVAHNEDAIHAREGIRVNDFDSVEQRLQPISLERRVKRKTNSPNKGSSNSADLNDPQEVVAGEGIGRNDIDINAANLQEKSEYQKVKETTRLFNKLYFKYLYEEQKRCNKPVARKGKKKKNGKRLIKRPDLKVMQEIIETNKCVYRKKRFGNLPGIEVGDRFCSRAEMLVIGLHSQTLGGIDSMTENKYGELEEYKRYQFPLAVSVVLSGVYEDDKDDLDTIWYTGEGGIKLLGNKKQFKDQVMAKGNLALKNNISQNVPVRVIRGHNSTSSYTGRVYTYDGLYRVASYRTVKGKTGFNVFQYQLRRIEGQPALASNQVCFGQTQSSKKLRGIVCDDISEGQEKIPVPATNFVDDPPVAPLGYTYCNSVQVTEGLTLPPADVGCNCKEACTDPEICACAKLNGDDFAYVCVNGGRLMEPKDVVFECGPNCKCGPACVNKTSQVGLKYRLEVFRTPDKGWAVRSLDFIPGGAFVCEYTGKLMRTKDLDNVSVNDYLFEIDCLQTIRGLDGRERRIGVVSSIHLDKIDDKNVPSEPEFCIDAGTTGGVARFINHSCGPNLFIQSVLSSHRDMSLARVALFASDNIPPLQELTYDYRYQLDSVECDGKVKVMPCFCGAKECRKRLH
ncbi:Histone-lysine N-methyltransferase, H3 lysine-9 specific SUVH4 [Thalictrum thalictroides]|uniref:Histone-lysine N-methyltransferase, H3 lysine-9 specific SUVH4 n=1 Tax=Thalictrum thalictroides TaxID=46969 RepID=A0A7J6VDN9_THATH|nr:Histone-lysine N-methyltransferase, H3 lysine-9 specific SUVH4 [Thalictrum thalictroides]